MKGAALHYPWGQGWVPLNNGSTFARFQDWDGGTASFPSWFRMYSVGEYRWLTPDPAGLAAVDITNPQSLNWYAYATLQGGQGLRSRWPPDRMWYREPDAWTRTSRLAVLTIYARFNCNGK